MHARLPRLRGLSLGVFYVTCVNEETPGDSLHRRALVVSNIPFEHVCMSSHILHAFTLRVRWDAAHPRRRRIATGAASAISASAPGVGTFTGTRKIRYSSWSKPLT